MEISREYGGEDQQFLFLIQDSVLTQHVIEPIRGENAIYIYSFVVTKLMSGQYKNIRTIGQQ